MLKTIFCTNGMMVTSFEEISNYTLRDVIKHSAG